MSDDPLDTAVDARTLRMRAARAGARAEAEAWVAAADFFLPQRGRLDDRTRVALAALLHRLIDGIETGIREHGVRQLAARSESALAEALAGGTDSAVERLAQAGLLRGTGLLPELIARVRLETLGAGLPVQAPVEGGTPSLINRCVENPDRVLASSAMAFTIAESRRRGADSHNLAQAELPAELQRQLVWAVAALLRERSRVSDEALPRLDRVLLDAAHRSLAAYDEGDRLEVAAMRFAAALDAPRSELGVRLVESLDDQRIMLFTALLAQALGTSYETARELVLDACGERVWLALRSLDLGRETIARIGYALCEADSRRDLDSFADALDGVMVLDPAEARDAIEPIRLDPQYRAAVAALRCAERPA